MTKRKNIGQRLEVDAAARADVPRRAGWWEPEYASEEEATAAMRAMEANIYSRGIDGMHKGPNYRWGYNDATGAGDLHIGAHQIPMEGHEAKLFQDADEATRQQLLPGLLKKQEAFLASVRAKRGVR